jgi:hypothetical protein
MKPRDLRAPIGARRVSLKAMPKPLASGFWLFLEKLIYRVVLYGFCNGERAGTRTLDPLIKSQMLYRLSYALP